MLRDSEHVHVEKRTSYELFWNTRIVYLVVHMNTETRRHEMDPRDTLAAHIVTHGVNEARLYDAMTRAFNQMVDVELYAEWVIRTIRK